MNKICLVDIRNVNENIFLQALKYIKEESYIVDLEDKRIIWNNYGFDDFFTFYNLNDNLNLIELFGKENILYMIKKYMKNSRLENPIRKKIKYIINNYDKYVNELIIQNIIE